MKEDMMSEEAFNELVNGFEYVATLTKYGRENIKYHVQRLQQENQELKQKLNWIAFGDDQELALRYLRKIGYVDFDEERKVYINKHNNEPFLLDDEEEKAYYIKDEELNEYTEQLEYQNQKLKKQLDKYENPEDMTLFTMWCTEKVKDENQELKQKYLNAVSDYETTMAEKEQLKDLIDIILAFPFFENECPLNIVFENDSKEEKAQNVFDKDDYCENNCNDDYKDCWLKYFKELQKEMIRNDKRN